MSAQSVLAFPVTDKENAPDAHPNVKNPRKRTITTANGGTQYRLRLKYHHWPLTSLQKMSIFQRNLVPVPLCVFVPPQRIAN